MKSVLILEDNIKTLNALCRLVKDVSKKISVFPVQTLEEAFSLTFMNKIDVFLIDIVLTPESPCDISGLLFAQQIRKHNNYKFTPIIFITALVDYQYISYSELHSYYFMEKPFSISKLKELLLDVIDFPTNSNMKESIFLRKDGILYQIQLNDVLYVEAKNHVISIYMLDSTLTFPYYTIKRFLKEADSPFFIQCNRNTVVNRNYINYIDMPNRYINIKKSNISLELGRSFRKNFIMDSAND